MRILMLNNEFPPLGGGTGTVNAALLSRLASAIDLDIDLVTSALGTEREEQQFAERIRLVKVPVNNQNLHHSSNRELLTYAARAYVESRRRHDRQPYDFCFAWSAVPAGAVAFALHRSSGLRYVVRVCGPDIPGFERRYQRLYPVLTSVIRATWRAAERVIVKCRAEADMIRRIDRTVETTLVPNGVDVTAFSATAGAAGGPLRLLCVARLIDRKGQHHLLTALKDVTEKGLDVTLELVGTGDAQPQLEGQVAALGLRDRVQFAGYVPRNRIARHYAAADVFVLPSYNEGMSVATLEAMAAGLALVTTKAGGLAELVSDEVNGLTFAWADAASLAAHLARLAADRDLVRRMGAASRTRAAEFSWDAMARTYLQMFDAVACNGSRTNLWKP
jgi:phosphatidylinositol alpha-1,6-mannosyltransferase